MKNTTRFRSFSQNKNREKNIGNKFALHNKQSKKELTQKKKRCFVSQKWQLKVAKKLAGQPVSYFQI